MIPSGFPCPKCSVRPDIACQHRPAAPEWRSRTNVLKERVVGPNVDSAPLVAEINDFLDRTGMSSNQFLGALRAD